MRQEIVTEMIGWISSLILVLTIGKQIYKQWQEDSSEGVSKWLFIGQVAASVGFTVYSWMVKNWVFVVTNLLMLLNAFIGLGIVFHHRRRPPGSAVRSASGKARCEDGRNSDASDPHAATAAGEGGDRFSLNDVLFMRQDPDPAMGRRN